MTRVHNFCAGPAALPEPVLARAQSELLDWQGQGASVMELSHRSKAFQGVIEDAEARLRRLLSVPDEYAVLFLQGGATQQFAAVPLNLAAADDSADYVITGHWSKKAWAEGKIHLNARVAASTEADGYGCVPEAEAISLGDGAYVHVCPNETIAGVAFDWVPDTQTPVVADLSSSILSRPLDVSRYGVIYAGAQKNIGPAGLVIVLVRRDLLGNARAGCPSMLNWKTAADNGSMFNTPPTFSVYLAGLVFEWLEDQGGLDAIEAVNLRKAERLYGLIDTSDFYSSPVEGGCRSIMNVPFLLRDDALDGIFLEQAEARGLINLKGHRSVGGMRASIYNAVSESAVDALCEFMADFEKEHG